MMNSAGLQQMVSGLKWVLGIEWVSAGGWMRMGADGCGWLAVCRGIRKYGFMGLKKHNSAYSSFGVIAAAVVAKSGYSGEAGCQLV